MFCVLGSLDFLCCLSNGDMILKVQETAVKHLSSDIIMLIQLVQVPQHFDNLTAPSCLFISHVVVLIPMAFFLYLLVILQFLRTLQNAAAALREHLVRHFDKTHWVYDIHAMLHQHQCNVMTLHSSMQCHDIELMLI